MVERQWYVWNAVSGLHYCVAAQLLPTQKGLVYHKIKEEPLQNYLDEFCYKLNRTTKGIKKSFSRNLDPYSVSIIEIKNKHVETIS